MRKVFTILTWTIFVSSCNTFTEKGILDNQNQLIEIVDIALRNKIQKFTWGDSDKEGLNLKLQKLQIDYFEIKIKGDKKTEMVTDLDSVVVFTRKSKNIFDDGERIVFDFAKSPRALGSFIVKQADYEQNQVSERWYFVTEGFD